MNAERPVRITAPWTPEQVASLNGFQACGRFHPFTCGSERHEQRPDLVATEQGWRCPDPECDYTQDWAWALMGDGSWDLSAVELVARERERGE